MQVQTGYNVNIQGIWVKEYRHSLFLFATFLQSEIIQNKKFFFQQEIFGKCECEI